MAIDHFLIYINIYPTYFVKILAGLVPPSIFLLAMVIFLKNWKAILTNTIYIEYIFVDEEINDFFALSQGLPLTYTTKYIVFLKCLIKIH